MKRPLLYSEILHQIHISRNPFGYPREIAKYEYRLGISPCAHPTAVDIPFVIPKRLERHIPAISVPLVDAFPVIVAVPVTQIDPKTNQSPGFFEMEYDDTFYADVMKRAEARYTACDQEETEEEDDDDDGNSTDDAKVVERGERKSDASLLNPSKETGLD